MKVVIIGSGNVATVLGGKIVSAGHEIVQVAGRNADHVSVLASLFKSAYTSNLLYIDWDADIYIISVSDSAVGVISEQLKLNNKVVVHTAAAVSREVLKGCSINYGVLYPLQTFRKELSLIPAIPVLIDASNEHTLEILKDFAAGWADNVSVATDEERLKLHLAAVFVNNFTNHLLAVAEAFCTANNLSFSLLRPLIEETILKTKKLSPSVAQTGPALRKDFGTIEKHRKLLSDNFAVLNLYNCLTDSVLRYYDENKI